MPLKTVTLGPTGLQVTNVCVGGAPLASMSETFGFAVPEDRAIAVLRAAFDSAITFYDTAASYGDGEGERRTGLAIRVHNGLRPGSVLATKADRDLTTGDFSGDQMRRSVEWSMKLLGLDRIQLMYLHDPEHTPFAAAMAPGGPVETLVKMKDEGLIEHLGVAGGPIPMEIRYVETGLFSVVITHNRYTMIDQTAAPLLDIAQARGLGVVNAAPYGSGLLALGPDAYPRYMYQAAPPYLLDQARALEAVCRRHGVSLRVAALQYSLRDPRIHSSIVGMTEVAHVQETIDAANTAVPDALWPELDDLIAAYNATHTPIADTRWPLPEGH